MSTEEGIVTKVEKETAWVKTKRTSSCEACSERDTCRTLGGGKEMEIEAINQADAEVGNKVVVTFETGSLFKLTFLIYIFPIICMIIGAVIGDKVAPDYGMDSSALSAIVGFVFFLAAFLIVRLLSDSLAKKAKYRARITRVKVR